MASSSAVASGTYGYLQRGERWMQASKWHARCLCCAAAAAGERACRSTPDAFTSAPPSLQGEGRVHERTRARQGARGGGGGGVPHSRVHHPARHLDGGEDVRGEHVVHQHQHPAAGAHHALELRGGHTRNGGATVRDASLHPCMCFWLARLCAARHRIRPVAGLRPRRGAPTDANPTRTQSTRTASSRNGCVRRAQCGEPAAPACACGPGEEEEARRGAAAARSGARPLAPISRR